MTGTAQEPLNMRPACSEKNSVLDSDLEQAARLNLIVSLRIHETEHGYYLTALFGLPPARKGALDMSKHPQMLPLIREPKKIWYLTSRRHRTAPRVHRSLGRLNEWMREKYPTEEIVLLRNQTVPGEPLLRGRKKKPEQSD